MNGASSLSYAGVMLLAGMAIPVMAAMSSGIGVRVANPSFATSTVFAIAFLVTAIAAVATGFPRLAQIASVPPYLYLGGLCVAFYGLSITFVAPRTPHPPLHGENVPPGVPAITSRCCSGVSEIIPCSSSGYPNDANTRPFTRKSGWPPCDDSTASAKLNASFLNLFAVTCPRSTGLNSCQWTEAHTQRTPPSTT